MAEVGTWVAKLMTDMTRLHVATTDWAEDDVRMRRRKFIERMK